MPRRRAAEKREVLPDAKYRDIVLTKFINNIIRNISFTCRITFYRTKTFP